MHAAALREGNEAMGVVDGGYDEGNQGARTMSWRCANRAKRAKDAARGSTGPATWRAQRQRLAEMHAASLLRVRASFNIDEAAAGRTADIEALSEGR